MDVVGVMAAYLPVVRVCTSLSREELSRLSRQCSTHTHHGQIFCHNTDYVHVNGHGRTFTVILAKHCIKLGGTAVAQWLRCCATNRKVGGSIPASVSGFFIDIKSFRSHYGPGVDSASNRNEYQEHFLGVKAAGA